MIALLHTMYQRSGTVLIFLAVVFLAVSIADGVTDANNDAYSEGVLTYQCEVDVERNVLLIFTITWVLTTV